MNASKKFSAPALSTALLLLLAIGGGCTDPVVLGSDNPATGEGGAGGGGGGGAGSTSSGGGAVDPSCDEFADEDSGDSLTVTIRNERAEPIYLGQVGACATPILFSIHKKDGGDVLGTSDNLEPERNRRSTCERPVGPPPPDCTALPAIRIEPGGSYAGSWSGIFYDQVTPPASCGLPPRDGETCYRARVAPAQEYRLETAAYLAARGCEGSACDCPAGAPGSSCVLQSGLNEVLGDPIRSTAIVDYPTVGAAEVVFR